MSAFMENLRQLFAECDLDGSGSLVKSEFIELCSKIGLTGEVAEETFNRLDIDRNGQITFDEFAAGFQQYKQTSATPSPAAAAAATNDKQQQAQRNQRSPSESPSSSFRSATSSRNSTSGPPSSSLSHQQQQQKQLATPSPVSVRARSRTGGGGPAPNSLARSGAAGPGSAGSSGNLTPSGRSTSGASNTLFSDLSSSYDLNSSCDSPHLQQSVSANDLLVSGAAAAATAEGLQLAAGGGAGSSTGSPMRDDDDVIVYSGDAIGAGSCGGGGGGAGANYQSGQFGSLLSSSSHTSYNQVKTMQDLLDCVQKLQNENQILTQIFFKDKREREEYISQLGEEFDHQLREVEERANKRAREELENEKRRLENMMQTERETLQHHYQTLEKISKMVKSPQGQGGVGSGGSGGKLDVDEGLFKVKSQLEDTFNENRQLKKSLLDTKTDVALIWKEMEKLKKQYEMKLSSAYEKQRETQYECDHIKKQLNLMQDSNRKLQDASDVITNYIADKVEPVIKVALDGGAGGDEHYGPNSLNGNALRMPASAANSRRGSILSEYLANNNNNNNDDDDADNDDDQNSDKISSGAGDLESMASSAGGQQRQSRLNTSVSSPRLNPPRANGLSLANELNGDGDANQQPAATSSENSLRVPQTTRQPPQQRQADANLKASKSAADLTPQPQTKPQAKAAAAEQENSPKQMADEKQFKVQEQNNVNGNVNSPPPTQQVATQPQAKTLATTTTSSFRNLGRHFMLGNRTLSETKPQQESEAAKTRLAEVKSISAEHVQEGPSVEPADGPSVATFNIILVGDSFVGKSSFAARFIEGSFVQGLISNCSIDFKTKSYKVDGVNYTVNLWDTAGQERFRSITASYFRKADGIILMYDVTDKRSYLNVRNWMSTISDTAAENVAVLLVGNKIDLRRSDNKTKCVPTEEGLRLAKEYDIVFLETSVKTGTNLLPSMGKLIRLIAQNNTPEEEDTDRIRLSDKNRTFNCMPKNC